MREYIEKMVKQRPKKINVLVEVTCDLCGKKDRNGWFDEDGTMDVDAVVIERQRGFRHYDCVDITTESYDVCPECWENKIKEFFPCPPHVEEDTH